MSDAKPDSIPVLWFDVRGCGPDELALELHPFPAELDGRIPAYLGIRPRSGGRPPPPARRVAGGEPVPDLIDDERALAIAQGSLDGTMELGTAVREDIALWVVATLHRARTASAERVRAVVREVFARVTDLSGAEFAQRHIQDIATRVAVQLTAHPGVVDPALARVAELETAVARMAPVIAAADAWLDDPCKGLGSNCEADLATAVTAYRAKVAGTSV